MSLVDIASGDFCGGDDLTAGIDNSVDFITQSGLPPSYDRRLRIRGGNIPAVNFLVARLSARPRSRRRKSCLQLLVAFVQIALQRASVDDGIIGSMGLH